MVTLFLDVHGNIDYKALIANSAFSSHAIALAHRACGSKNPPDWEKIWAYLNDQTHCADRRK